MDKNELIQDFIFKIEGTFRDSTPSFVPSEESITKFKKHCETFIGHFPECAEQYNVKEPPEEDLAGRHEHWIHKTVALIAEGIIHPEIREKIYRIQELRFFAEIIKRNPEVKRQEMELVSA